MQFLYVRDGVRAARRSLVVEARWRDEARSGPIGVGFTASKKAGNAVARNRSRRRLKEAARKLLPELGLAGADYVIVARAVTAETTWDGLLDDLGNALIRLRADLEGGATRPHMPRAQRPERKIKPNAASESE